LIDKKEKNLWLILASALIKIAAGNLVNFLFISKARHLLFMKLLQSGQHFGTAKQILRLGGIILTEAGYMPRIEVPWHFHENAYFFYHLKGHLDEVNKKKSLTCTPGTLLFHNWQDPHYDKKFSTDALFFHIELEKNWFERHQVDPAIQEGSMRLENPAFRSVFQTIHRESKINDNITQLSVDGSLLQAFAMMMRHAKRERSGIPAWVKKAREILNDSDPDELSLQQLSRETGIHPVHLSREFPKYFNAGFGDYIRNIRIGKAAEHLTNSDLSIAAIAYHCGFADQSHLTRCFKSVHGLTPLKYRKSAGKR
jgi:AraC family transcriptional regulator